MRKAKTPEIINKRPCQICGKPIARAAKYTCSISCAVELRHRLPKRKGESQPEPQPEQEWPAWMLHEKPFLRHDVDPGDGIVLRLPGPNPERFRGLLGSSASYAEERGSKNP